MRLPFLSALVLATTLAASADPLTKEFEIDFFREVPNRNLQALAVRSDGRIVSGPALRELPLALPADLLWTMRPSTDGAGLLLGTGPEGKVLRVTPAAGVAAATVEVAADLDATHVFAVLALDARTFLAGSSPQGAVSLVRDGQVVASVALPVDSIFDFAPAPGAPGAVLVATGNPGRIYRLDLAAFESAGIVAAKAGAETLAKGGIALFGEVRDRNLRRLLTLPDGRVIAGSAPKGNVYAFPAAGGAPRLLQENRDAEVTDLILDGDGGAFFAAITFSSTGAEARVSRPPAPNAAPGATSPPEPAEIEPVRAEKFGGRAQVVHFPAQGLPDVVVARPSTAFYALAWREAAGHRWLLIAGGEQGELVAYVPAERRSLNLGAVTSAQINAILPAGRDAGSGFRLLRNNPGGLSELSFSPEGPRSVETRKLDLGAPAELGQLRFMPLGSPPDSLRVAVRTSFGSDELEGWSDWVPLTEREGGWSAPGLRGRYVQLRLVPSLDSAPSFQVGRATLHYLPQNRRPTLTDFRIFPANLGLVPAGESNPAAAVTTLGQMLAPSKDDAPRSRSLLSSPVVPAPGAQIVYWTLADPDDDNLAATFALAPESEEKWTDLAIDTTESYVQFDVSHLPEGRYRTRLVVREQAPRPEAQRLDYTFETDLLTVDRTAPAIVSATSQFTTAVLRVEIAGRDALSLLQGAEFILNNGERLAVEHPADGILDGRSETFVAEFPLRRTAGATSVEIVLYDQNGNSAARRLSCK